MKNQTIITLIAVATIASILVTAAAVSQDALAKCKKKYRGGHSDNSRQTIAQTNFCGNGYLAMQISCKNLASQIQGNGNAVNVIGL
ncbi:MAG TPA: hypothetical protein VH796_11715 [Nitrososphaeraceae archaeon]|jgi:hypothetical protein